MIFTCIDRLHHPMNHRKYTILSHYYIILSYIENPVTIVIISGFSPESSRPALEAASATPPKEIHLAGGVRSAALRTARGATKDGGQKRRLERNKDGGLNGF